MNWLLLKNSLLVSSGATLLSVGAGFVAALWLVTLGTSWQKRSLAVSIMALALPPFLVTNCWLHFLGLSGVWRRWLPLNIYSTGGTIWILALLTWPIPLLATLSAWRRIDAAQLESDPALRGLALVRWLLWPMARVTLGQAAVLVFVLALNNFAVPAILQVKVFPAEIWLRFSTNFDFAGALTLSWPFLVAPVLLAWSLQRAESNWPRQNPSATARAVRRSLGSAWFWSCGFFTLTILFLSVVLPLLQIVAVERTWTELPKVVRAVPGVIWNSVAFSAATASVCVALALAALVSPKSKVQSPKSSNSRSFGPWTLDFGLWTLWLPFLMPGVLLGIGLVFLLNRPMLEVIYQSAAIVLLAWTIRYLALGWTGVAVAFRGIDRDLTDAARLEGASGFALLRHGIWPQIAPQTGAAWYVIYLLCLWDVETLILICPPGGETLALRIFNLLHYGHNAQVNALCLLLLGLAVAPLLAWNLGQRLTRMNERS